MTTPLTQPTPLRPDGPHKGRRVLAAVGAMAIVAALAAAFLIGRGSSDDKATKPAVAPLASPSTGSDVQLRPIAGVPLPFSALHGPRITENGEAAGYSQSPLGAAIAAVQVLARTSPSAGSNLFDPVLASQVTGTNLAAMKLAIRDEYQVLRAATPVPDGEPIPGNDAKVSGYLVLTYGASNASIDVVLDSAALGTSSQLVSFTVQLSWQDGDWRIVAPPNGDWGSVATTLGDPPAGMQKYAAA